MADDWQHTQDDMDAALSAPTGDAALRGPDATRSPSDPTAPQNVQRPAEAPTAGAGRTISTGLPLDADAADMAAAIAADQAARTPIDAAQVVLPDLDPKAAAAALLDPSAIDLLADVDLNVKVELGRSRLLVEEVLRLGPGSVVELDKLAGDPVDVFVNERLVARGEVLVLNENFCVRINEIRTDFGDPIGPED